MDQVIAAAGLRKHFGRPGHQIEAVGGVSFEVERGEIFGFLGPNGAGKTTTLRMLTTLLPIDAGTATVAGFDVAHHSGRVRQRIGYVSQLGGADDLATGRENLMLQGRLYGGEKRAVAARVDDVLGLLDLAGFAERRVRTYSGGQRRRLDVALGIVHEPTVLFLDEPTTGLDPQNRANLWDHLRSLREQGTTVFLTTHYLEEADSLCDRVMILDHGSIVAEGSPRELKRQVMGDSVLLEVADEPNGLARARGALEGAGFVREMATTADGLLRLYVDDGARALPEVLRRLDAIDVNVKTISLSAPSLDDVFLAKTGRSLRDGTALPAEVAA
jgi:ABC-2 type transport system ATP-binding protein